MTKKFYRSKYEFPTRIIKSGQYDGTLQIGHIRAKQDIEKQIKRPLHKDTKIVTKGGNWCFVEPQEKKNETGN